MKKRLDFSSDIVMYQIAFLGFSIFVVVIILAWAIFSGNVNYYLMVLVAVMFMGGGNVFAAKFSSVTIEGDIFLIKNFFKPKREINLSSFDKIVRMNTILFIPASPYFTILLKTGEKIYFVAKYSEKAGYAVQDKKKLVKHMTGEIESYIKTNGIDEGDRAV